LPLSPLALGEGRRNDLGTVFRYTADGALKPAEAAFKRTCQVCARTGVDVYRADGRIALPDGRVAEGVGVAVACADCLRAGRVEKNCSFEVDEVIRRYLDAFHRRDRTHLFRLRRLVELAAAYRQTPDGPLFLQGQDWPLCCGDLTEFTGPPRNKKDLLRLTKSGVYWEGQVKKNRVDFEESGPPESYTEVAVFQCLACQKVYWTWQFS
jgi:hypothetical protein